MFFCPELIALSDLEANITTLSKADVTSTPGFCGHCQWPQTSPCSSRIVQPPSALGCHSHAPSSTALLHSQLQLMLKYLPSIATDRSELLVMFILDIPPPP